MRDVYQALAFLKEKSGLGKLEFNSAGKVEIVFNKTISVIVSKVDQTSLELVSYLNAPAFGDSYAAAIGLLHANFLGQGTGSGRVALDPEDDSLLYCERLDVAHLDEAGLEARVLAFVKYATFWHSEAATKLLAPVAGGATSRRQDRFEAEVIIRS